MYIFMADSLSFWLAGFGTNILQTNLMGAV